MMKRVSVLFVAMICALPAGRAALADADPAKGKSVFNQCRACHRLEEGKNMVGPHLHHLFGRKAGTVKGFNFSTAMKNSGIVWDEKKLDAYIANPKEVVPNGKMAYPGLKNAGQRADLIAYLKQATK